MGAILISAATERRIGQDIAGIARSHPVVVLHDDMTDAQTAEVEVAYFSSDLWPVGSRQFFGVVQRSPNLRWFHTMSAGVDSPVFGAMRQRGVRLTTSSGSAALPIAQTVLLYVLALNKGLPAWTDAQRREAWEPHTSADLQGSRLVVVGMGPIGRHAARLAQAFDIEVVGVRRTPQGDEPCRTVTFQQLDTELALADHVVLALPLTDDTRLLFDERRLQVIKRGAAFINVGRGELVDEDALIGALRSGQLSGAGLDVFRTEPLPTGSPLWSMPNVIVTPHNSGAAEGNVAKVDEIFLANLHRFANGEPLMNEVD